MMSCWWVYGWLSLRWEPNAPGWEFHVAEAYAWVGHRPPPDGNGWPTWPRRPAWALICETQNTNVPAIRFYRPWAFRLEGGFIILFEDMMPGRTVAVS